MYKRQVYVPVRTGISDDQYIQILSGLTDGDVIGYDPSTLTNAGDVYKRQALYSCPIPGTLRTGRAAHPCGGAWAAMKSG